ncbi:hypothetical protein AeRB84_008129, partial [Aphanomyces euteiches]
MFGFTSSTTSPTMKAAATIAYLATALVAFSDAQQVGTSKPEVHPSLP